MAQLNTLLSLNTAPTSRSASPKTSLLQSEKRPLETPDTPEAAPSETSGLNGQTPVKAEKSRFEELLEESRRSQADALPPADAHPKEPQPAPAQEPVFTALGLFGGNPLPLEGQTLPPAADTAQGDALAAAIMTAPSGSAAVGSPGAAPATLFASSQALPTLFDLDLELDGSAPSLFGNAAMARTPLQNSSMPPAASNFVAAAAGPILAANDATLPAAMVLTEAASAANASSAAGGLQALVTGTPQVPAGLTAGQSTVAPTQVPGTGIGNPALQPSATGIVPPASAASGSELLATVAGPGQAAQVAQQPAEQSAAQMAISTAEVSNALVAATGDAVTVTASGVQTEAAAGDSAVQATMPATNVQVQVAETAWQPDAAERARAWRGIATLDPAGGLQQGAGPGLAQGLAPAGRHEFSFNYPAMAGQGGQLQQFAEALRQAGGAVEAGSQSPLQTAAASGASSSTAQTADRGGSAFNAGSPGPELQQAWRGDSTAAGVTVAGGRAAAGTLNFAQGMQASSFGQPLGQSFGDSEWAESVTRRVALMAGQKVSSAQIELDPPELGAMTVRVSVTGDQANVTFTSAHAQVREALEQTFTRLQDMLGQQGLQLADAQVSDQSAARQQQGEGRGGQGGAGVFADEDDAGPVTMQSLKVPKGLVDYYA